MRNNLFLIGAINLCLSASAYALSPDAFTQLEYHVNTGVGKTLPYAADKQTDAFKKAFSFINLDDDISVKLVTYIDTADRAFKADNIQIRVREHVTKPRKSKITVKLRAANPEGFGEVSDYKKAEIDFTNDRSAYSVSYDVPYSPADIDVKRVDIESVFNILKKDDTVWEIVGPIYENNKDKLQQTLVMRTHGWEGSLKDPRYENLEIDFQLWTPYYRKPRVTFTEFSFKGHASDKSYLEEAYNFLNEEVNKVNMPSENNGSKTSATFKMSKGFN
ncbi:hypothetical protein [Shewanella colwelliana]|uniref:DUF3857 domain-containing protein n=1 Tax=Shewanella colwelliana TaxID=23 RepID=A0ABQ4NWE1_SHECO|nr:hypothetical protein [Shewanella colwelliana]MDX1281132.1 hypothetical protein [Shewanella colwelliana]GIU37957.1 hypothetical protein TUM3794_09550 [Shewanella colwelliana]